MSHSFAAKITDHAADGDRWKYEWVPVYQDDAGYGNWTELSNEMMPGSGDWTSEQYARNHAEQSSDFDGQAVPNNTIVMMQCEELAEECEYWFCYVYGSASSPQTMLPADKDTETAQSDTWDITDQGANDGVIFHTMRVAYNHSGDKKLYGYTRVVTVDSAGRILSISAETRYEIDATTLCTGSA